MSKHYTTLLQAVTKANAAVSIETMGLREMAFTTADRLAQIEKIRGLKVAADKAFDEFVAVHGKAP